MDPPSPANEINRAMNGHFENWSCGIQPQIDPFGQLSPKICGLLLASNTYVEVGYSKHNVLLESRGYCLDGGLLYVEDRCLIIEQRRLHLEAPAPRSRIWGARASARP